MLKCIFAFIFVLVFVLSGGAYVSDKSDETGGQLSAPVQDASTAPAPAHTHTKITESNMSSPTQGAAPFEDSNKSKYENFVKVDEGYSILDYCSVSGDEFDYAVYEVGESEKNEDEFDRNMGYFDMQIYWIVVVLKNGEVIGVLRQNRNEYAQPIPSVSTLVLETDINFDGANDILLWLGHFGNQGLIRYACYLQTNDGFIICPSFTKIMNPAVDTEGKVILSSWRNMAVSHSWAIYDYINGEYVETERLTEEPASSDNNDESIVWSWTDEVFANGEWQVREYFTENDYDKETLYSEKVYGETAYWDIGSDRWRTLFNNGKMSDFSIYSSEKVLIP